MQIKCSSKASLRWVSMLTSYQNQHYNFPDTAGTPNIIYIHQRRQWHPTPVLLPGKSHGRRSLEGCSPWGCWGSDMTEQLHFHFSLSCIGEGNGNPLQCSCLENPRDGGVWWAAIYGVTQSQTQLKWLTSSSVYIYTHTHTHLHTHTHMVPIHIVKAMVFQ